MKVFRSLAEYEAGHHTVATIGTFDGVHIGHQVILNRLMEAARERNGESLLVTFHPHPRLVLFPDDNPLRLLHELEEKIDMLDRIGLDRLLILPFTREFSRITSRQFIQEILVQSAAISHIIIGYDHRFGKNRTGGLEELQNHAKEGNYTVEEIPAQRINEAKVSSTKIRKALAAGEVETANRYLGYQYAIEGEVIHGEKQGRLLGYPTANLKLSDPLKLTPANGVYFVQVHIDSRTFYGMMNIGNKPTMGEFVRGYEVYIFDLNEDLYGKNIRVSFLEYIRPEEKFEGLDALIAAIDGDRDYCLKRIAEREGK